MNLVRPTVGAAIGGAIGAVIWALVVYYLNVEIGWIAWGIGILAGIGARGAGGVNLSPATGVLAALVAIVSILAGKYAVVEIMVNEFTGEATSVEWTDEYAMTYLADDLIEEFIEEGREVNWPGGMPNRELDSGDDYPVEVWAEATTHWKSMSVAERQAFKDTRRAEIKEQIEAYSGEMRMEGFMSSFGLMDLVFIGLAVVTAFKIGSGSSAVSET